MTDQQVVVVGAGTAGITLAEALRVHGHTGPIIVLGEEHHPPYSRPPLSKQVLDGTWPADRAGLRTPEELSRLGIQVRTGVAATGVDVAHRRLTTTAESLPFDVLVLAPGNQPSHPVELAGAQGLHSLDDAHALRRALAGEGPVAVIGSGVLAQELASAAIKAGHTTTLIGRGGRLGLGAVGDLLSARLIEHHRDHGVVLRLDSPAVALAPGGVQLADGTVVPARTVVAAVGARPRTDWLRDSPVELTATGQIRCDDHGRVLLDTTETTAPTDTTAPTETPAPTETTAQSETTPSGATLLPTTPLPTTQIAPAQTQTTQSAPAQIYAIGDAAAWPHPVTGDPEVVPHQLSAVQQALAVAATLTHAPPEPAAEPFFWTELHGSRIQAYGRFEGTTLTPVEKGVWAAVADGRVTGVIGWASPRAFRSARALVAQHQPHP